MNSYECQELRELKWKLATLNCNCKVCSPVRGPEMQDRRCIIQDLHATVPQVPHDPSKCHYMWKASTGFREDIYCPSCYLTVDDIRQKFSKFFSDKETEAETSQFICDNSTDQSECSRSKLEKSTSSSKPLLKYFSDLIFHGDNADAETCCPKRKSGTHIQNQRQHGVTFADCSSDTESSTTLEKFVKDSELDSCTFLEKPCKHEEVKTNSDFTDDETSFMHQLVKPSHPQNLQFFSDRMDDMNYKIVHAENPLADCVCMTDFINAIRPPWLDTIPFKNKRSANANNSTAS